LFFSQIFFLLPNQVLAQGIISILPFEPTQLNFVEKSNYDSLKTMAQTEPIKIVNTVLPEDIGSEGIVQVTIPGTSLQYKFKCTLSEYEDANNFVWCGVLQTSDGTPSLDRMILVKKDGLLLGDIQVNYLIYKIFPIAAGKQMFFKWPNLTGNITTKPDSEKSEAACFITNTTQCKVRVLIAYSPELANSISEKIIVLQAIAFIAESNFIFGNSTILHRLVLTDVYKIAASDFSEGNSQDVPLATVKGYLQTTSSLLNQKRLETKSDVVMVLCSGFGWTSVADLGVSTFTGPHCPYTNDILASIIPFSGAQGGRRSFTHELGHLFSAMHNFVSMQYPGGGGCTVPRCAYTWCNNGIDHFTMMHAVDNGGVRDQVFSNSTTTIDNKHVGDYDHCNAKGIQECGCSVANMLSEPICSPTLAVTFNKTCKPTKAILKVTNANACGTGLKYEFSHSINGFGYALSCPASTSSTCDVGFFAGSLAPGDYLFVRVKVYKVVNGVNQVKATLFGSYNTCTVPLLSVDDRQSEFTGNADFILFPNPANQSILLSAAKNYDKPLECNIYDSRGVFQKQMKIETPTEGLEANDIEIPIAELKSGLYFLKVNLIDEVKILKFIKQ
jgi:Secretion system C-terminal sorting domain/Metallo-peptidase family M12